MANSGIVQLKNEQSYTHCAKMEWEGGPNKHTKSIISSIALSRQRRAFREKEEDSHELSMYPKIDPLFGNDILNEDKNLCSAFAIDKKKNDYQKQDFIILSDAKENLTAKDGDHKKAFYFLLSLVVLCLIVPLLFANS